MSVARDEERRPVDVVGFGMIVPATIVVVDAMPALNTAAEWKDVREFVFDDAAIVATLLASWGIQAGLIGTTLGDDDAGHRTVRRLAGSGVVGDFRTSPDVPTPYELDISDSQGNRTYFWRKDPTVLATLETADLSLLTGARLLYVDWYDGDAILRPMQRARALGIPVFLNLEHAHEERSLLERLAPHVSLCQAVTDPAQTRPDEAELLAYKLLDMGVRTVIVTLAGSGCLAAAGREVVRVGAPLVEVVDGCGAGATFSAGFIYGYLQGWGLEAAARFAVAAASLKTTVVGPRAFPVAEVQALAQALAARSSSRVKSTPEHGIRQPWGA